jgi:tetratricopeptide (TPR) repeat protein
MRRVSIQGKSFELLSALLECPGELMTREALYARLWPGVSGDYQRGLDTAVRKLRQALSDPAERPVYIETLLRRGYRLLTHVSVDPPSPGAAPGIGRDAFFPSSALWQVDSKAGRLYMEGHHCWNKRTPVSQKRALACFLRAQELDPTNGDYNAAVALTHLMLGWHGVERPVDAIAEAKSAAMVALLHDRAQVLACVVLAMARGAFDYDLKGGLADLRTAIRAAPDHAWGCLQIAIFTLAIGEKEEAEGALRKAREIDPVSPTILAVQAFGLYLSGRLEEAEEVGREAVGRDPEFGLAHFYYGMVLTARRRFDEAVRNLALADQLMVEAMDVRAILAVAMALSGDREKATRIDEELEEAARFRYVDAYSRALLKDALGMRDAAVGLLEQSWEDHSHWFCLAAVDPKLEALRADNRVQALLRRLRR